MTKFLPRRHDTDTSDFTFVVHDCETGRDGIPATTEIFGYFGPASGEDDEDFVTTASMVVPIGSPIARMAYRVSRDQALIERAAAMLSQTAWCCRCAAAACVALDELRLVEAIEHALAGGCP
jgi:hypothetical protein